MFIGVFAIVVKTAFFAWEAAVLPLNYARELSFEIKHFLHILARASFGVSCKSCCTVPDPSRL
jgi:hypothetical protein